MEVIQGTYNIPLVLLSIFIAIIAAYISIDLMEMYGKANDKGGRIKWHILVSISLGIGIWLMHFIGMLAYHLPIPVHYDGIITVASLLLAIIVCFIGIPMVRKNDVIHIVYGAVIIGVGISGMHYLGMHAMHMEALHVYDSTLVIISIIDAIVVSGVGLFAIQYIHQKHLKPTMIIKFMVATLLGSAISSMHYIGMSAVVYMTGTMTNVHREGLFIIDSDFLIVEMIAAGIILIFFILYIVVSERSLHEKLNHESTLLKLSENKMRTLLDNIADTVVVISDKGIIDFFNKAAEQMFGYQRDEVINRNITMLMGSDNAVQHGMHLDRYKDTGQSKIIDVGGRQLIAFDKNGNEILISLSVNKVESETGIQFIGIIHDITEHKRELDTMKRLADHDPLTGLANRRKLLHHLEYSLSTAKKHNSMACLIFIDLDGFKTVNDTLGHDAGDELLKQVSLQLKEKIREKDIVARIGGDEFCVLMENVKNKAGAERLVNNILPSFRSPFQIFDNIATVTASIGIALFPQDADDAEALIKNADSAMYLSKKYGKNQYQFYEDSNDTESEKM